MKSISLILFWGLVVVTSLAQNESSVRMTETENLVSTEKVIAPVTYSTSTIQTPKPLSIKQIEPLQKPFSENARIQPATSGKFIAKIKHNLKPQKKLQPEKTQRGSTFWAILFGLISIVTFLLLFSEQNWVFWFISMISMTIALLINPKVAEILAMISCVVSLVLIIVGITTSNAMALLLGLLMLIYVAAMIGIT
ncbi:MAG: hypothetical protein NZ516_11885 [Raineya sp.]|nr:hypothetical protein [Raineya sp.]